LNRQQERERKVATPASRDGHPVRQIASASRGLIVLRLAMISSTPSAGITT
jgi:hypothetical protein